MRKLRNGDKDAPMRTISRQQAASVLGLIAAGLLLFGLGTFSGRFWGSSSHYGGSTWGITPKKADTLVVYNYANRDWEYPRNFAFFVEHGIKENDGADYVVILQQSDHPPKRSIPRTYCLQLHAPPLPPYVKTIVKEENLECYSWGAFGWLLNSKMIAINKYKYFVLIDSSVRGPFIPPYVPSSIPWHRMLTLRLNGATKMVGPVISCEGAPFKGKGEDAWKSSPAVQSYAVAFDQRALRLIRRDPEITRCYWDKWDSTWYGELGATKAILNAGYNIDCLIHRFQGLDWRKKKNWECNQRMNPTGEKWMDGFTLSIYELMFVKLKDHLKFSTNSLALNAIKYSDWMDGLVSGKIDIFKNDFIEKPEEFKAPYVNMQKARSPQCFDHGFYRHSNQDFAGWTDEQLWQNFIYSGQFENRPHRWMCSWEVPPELLDELDRHHEQKHPYVKRKREAAAIEAASLAEKTQKAMPSEKELQRLRSAIV